MSDQAWNREAVRAAYRSPEPLRARQALYSYSERASDFVGWALAQVGDLSGRVLDVGCGPGAYLRRVPSAVGLDLSFGMTSAAPKGRVVVGDAAVLPFPDDTFDVVLAMHVLYHVADIALASAELSRVVRTGGVVLLGTNGAGHLSALRELLARSTGVSSLPPGPAARFNLENGPAQVAQALEVTDVRVDRNRVAVPDATAVVQYLDSTRSVYESALPATTLWTHVLDRALAIVQAQVDEQGAWVAETEGGVIVARPLS